MIIFDKDGKFFRVIKNTVLCITCPFDDLIPLCAFLPGTLGDCTWYRHKRRRVSFSPHNPSRCPFHEVWSTERTVFYTGKRRRRRYSILKPTPTPPTTPRTQTHSFHTVSGCQNIWVHTQTKTKKYTRSYNRNDIRHEWRSYDKNQSRFRKENRKPVVIWQQCSEVSMQDGKKKGVIHNNLWKQLHQKPSIVSCKEVIKNYKKSVVSNLKWFMNPWKILDTMATKMHNLW